jgi:hypothetical protein
VLPSTEEEAAGGMARVRGATGAGVLEGALERGGGKGRMEAAGHAVCSAQTQAALHRMPRCTGPTQRCVGMPAPAPRSAPAQAGPLNTPGGVRAAA